ncbi:MAG: metal ABC transporter ATP-binding protein [Gemmobacter sp.]|uniref:metal ABC transporter ATP-binding protein n=1 Tax=Gemmobacter sp. TaxID=1898957 RepID=UPI001A5F099C|nr:metal ABC transporter ATP-binding protein [Gemmobacter sp.]MBL8563113.1 metal ABC transporter ATP-binding protein [Gemmobacter sp.]
MKAVEFQGLEVQYGDMPALRDASGSFETAAMTAIVGPNGAGKSTLLKAALGLIPSTGRVAFFGKPLAEMRARVAYVPQRASVDWDFPVRVIDVVVQGLYRELGLLGRLRLSHRRRALDCLERVGMADYASRQIGALSGGQQQRVFLARALAQNADLYLLDEPFAGVDAATESAIIAVLKSLRDQGRSVVAVHHDLATVPAYFDRVLLLNRHVQAEGPVAETFTPEALARLYGGLLPQLS